MALGASGAQVGTRFLSAWESGVFPAYRKHLLEAGQTDSVVTRAFTGRPARGMRNHFLEEYLKEGPEPLAFPLQMLATRDIYEEARARDEGDHFLLLAGQELGMLKDGQGAAEIVAEIVSGAEATLLARLAGEAPAGAG